MYKELASTLKSFIPTSEELDALLVNYNKHSFIHSGDNLFGEKYEAWVYEYLKLWANNCSDVSDFMIKDSSLKISTPVNGLTYDKNGQIIFMDSGKKVAEFDGIFKYKDRVVFVESSVSELRSYYRRLEGKIEFKRNLLVDYFNTEEVYLLLVTRPKKKSMVYRSNPHLVLYSLKFCL